MALLSLALLRRFDLGSSFFIYFALSAALLVVTFIDLDHWIIPDFITLPGIPLGIAASFLLPTTWLNSLIGAVAGGGLLWIISMAFFLIRKEEGMGMGDVKLLAMLGAFLGWQALPVVVLSASTVGTIVGVGLMLAGKLPGKAMVHDVTEEQPKAPPQDNTQQPTPWEPPARAVPFGPFLALGALTHLFYGPALIGAYLSLIRG